MSGPNKLIVSKMMDNQVTLVKQNPEIGPTCIIALDKKEKYTYLVPCINDQEDFLLLAEKLEESAQKLRVLANKISASDEKPESVH